MADRSDPSTKIFYERDDRYTSESSVWKQAYSYRSLYKTFSDRDDPYVRDAYMETRLKEAYETRSALGVYSYWTLNINKSIFRWPLMPGSH